MYTFKKLTTQKINIKLILMLTGLFTASIAVAKEHILLKNESEAVGYSVALLGGDSFFLDRDKIRILRPDLNNDGKEDIFITHRDHCGSRGCSGVTLLSTSNGYCPAGELNELTENSWNEPNFTPMVCKNF